MATRFIFAALNSRKSGEGRMSNRTKIVRCFAVLLAVFFFTPSVGIIVGFPDETLEELGDPVTRIIAVCEDNDADLLVVGRRGAGLAERVILGSVADRLCHLSPCPVQVVP